MARAATTTASYIASEALAFSGCWPGYRPENAELKAVTACWSTLGPVIPYIHLLALLRPMALARSIEAPVSPVMKGTFRCPCAATSEKKVLASAGVAWKKTHWGLPLKAVATSDE